MEALALGDEDPIIAQCKLKLGSFPLDEVFDEPLAQRVRGFQHIHGLEENGFIDEALLALLGIQETPNA